MIFLIIEKIIKRNFELCIPEIWNFTKQSDKIRKLDLFYKNRFLTLRLHSGGQKCAARKSILKFVKNNNIIDKISFVIKMKQIVTNQLIYLNNPQFLL